MSEPALGERSDAWGVIEDGQFRALPKDPMIAANLGPPPFNVTRPDGVVLHIIAEADFLADVAALRDLLGCDGTVEVDGGRLLFVPDETGEPNP